MLITHDEVLTTLGILLTMSKESLICALKDRMDLEGVELTNFCFQSMRVYYEKGFIVVDYGLEFTGIEANNQMDIAVDKVLNLDARMIFDRQSTLIGLAMNRIDFHNFLEGKIG